jgi:hypothetical protein
MLLINDGSGRFVNNIEEFAPLLQRAGMICDAHRTDLNKDGREDLIVVGEWTPVRIFVNVNNTLMDQTDQWISTAATGWWNRILGSDFDNDGDEDFIIGNYGLNNQFGVSPEKPATMVYKDINNDGQVDAFFNYFIGEQSFPYASRDEALGQVSFLKTRFPDYTSYSNATLDKVFTDEEMQGATTLKAENLRTVYFENKGDRFEEKPLPIEFQFSPVYALAACDVDQDGDQDVITGGNESKVRVRLGKTDANKGFVFMNDGKGNFTYVPQYTSGINADGDVRDIVCLSRAGQTILLISETGEPIQSYVVDTKPVLP